MVYLRRDAMMIVDNQNRESFSSHDRLRHVILSEAKNLRRERIVGLHLRSFASLRMTSGWITDLECQKSSSRPHEFIQRGNFFIWPCV